MKNVSLTWRARLRIARRHSQSSARHSWALKACNIRSPANVVAATVFLGAALVPGCAAQARTPSTATDGKRVQVLRIIEAGSAKANFVRKSRSAAKAVKRKAVVRKSIDGADAAPNQIANPETSTPTVAGGTPEQNESTQTSVEQAATAGTLPFRDRAVAFASFSDDGADIGPLTKDILRSAESVIVNRSVVENPTDIADQEASKSGGRSLPILHILAIVSGAILAGFGLVSSRRRRVRATW